MISPTSKAKAPVYTVVISEKGGSERREAFDRTELSVGRVQGNDLMLPKGNVSKRHARVLYRDGRFIVTDLNSTNGTYVNRRRISQATIVREGDRIYIGDFVLRIELNEGSADDSAQAPEGSGSGPVPAGESLVSVHAPRADALPSEPTDEPFPPLPPQPRLPSARRPSLPGPDTTGDNHSSGRMRVAPSRPNLEHASISQEDIVDEDAQAHRIAVSSVVRHVAEGLDAGALVGDVDTALRARIEKLVAEQVTAQRKEGQVADTVSGERLAAEARAELLELGPLTALVDSDEVTEIVVPRFDRVEVTRGNRIERVEPPFSSEQALHWTLARLCQRAGRPLSADEHVVERRLPQGVKLSAVIGPAATSGGVLVVRRPERLYRTLEELVRQGAISRAIATFLQQCIAARLNLLVTGPDDRGRGYLLSALTAAAGDGQIVAAQDERDVIMQAGATRIGLGDAPDVARVLRAAGKIPATRLVAELSSAAAMAAVVDVIGDGADGVLAELRAPNLRRALARLSAEVAGARSSSSVSAARESVAAAFDLVLEVVQMRDGRHRVLRVAELIGTSGDEIRVQDIFSFLIERTAVGGAIEGSFSPSGTVPRIAEDLAARGLVVESSMFSRPPSR